MLRLTEHADVSSDATCKEALPQTGREGLLFFYFSFCSVARWDATFGAFRGIGEGGTAAPRGSWSRGKAPAYPEYARGVAPCSPLERALRPAPRVTFSPMRKSPKNLQGLRPLEPAGAKSPPFSRLLRSAPARAGLVSATDAEEFATLRWWANRSCCFLWLHRGNTLCC